jgi:hypothetical protein
MSRLWQIILKKWSCGKCGFSTGRRWVVERHIANPRIHDGDAEVVSYEEYVTGVRTQVFSAPTYAYRTRPYTTQYRRQLRHSHITSSDIMITIVDLIDNDWRETFRAMFRSCIEQDTICGIGNPAMFRADDGSLIYINYYGYVCPNCFSIGITYDQKAARAIADGYHICPSGFATHSAISPDRESLMLEKLRNQLGELLFDVVKTIAQDKPLVLVGHTEYSDFSRFYWKTRPTDFRELERNVIFCGGRSVLNDFKLQELFKFYDNTNNAFDIQFDDHTFKYDLWLAIQLV